MSSVALPRIFCAVLGLLLAGGGAQAQAPAFAAAQERGELRIGIPYLAAEPAAGEKIRTPERLDTAIAERLAQQLGLPLRLSQVPQAGAAAALQAGQVDLVLSEQALPADEAVAATLAALDTGYRTRPKAVIRNDTAMRVPADAAGRSVCLAGAAVAAQALAAQWGAQVRIYAVPSDALVAVREGQCDLGLIDDAVWQPLMRFPEWRAFSATLAPAGPQFEHRWLVPATALAEQTWLRKTMRSWQREGVWQVLTAKWARDVAFDVYLDQEVPDCHG